MINEFDCALNPKAYTKIVQASMKSITIQLLAVRLKENYCHQFQVRFPPGLGLSVLWSFGRLPMVPAIQPIYQNVLEICLEVDNFYIGWLGQYRYPLYFLTCHDHVTSYSTIASFKRFSLISTLELELILSRKKPASRPAEFSRHGKASAKKGQGSGHWKSRESGTFPNYSFSILELLEFLYASFERQQ